MITVVGIAVTGANTYVTWSLRDEVGKLYRCPEWMKKFKLNEHEKQNTVRSLKEKLVAFNLKFNELCEEEKNESPDT